MKNLFRSSLSLPFILTLVIPGLAQTLLPEQAVAPSLKTTVFIYNMARVPSQVLAQAEGETSRIFREVDIEMEWMECPCPRPLSPADVMLRIIPRLFRSTRADFRDNDLGFAPSSEEGGVLATIFFDRVEAITKGGPVAPILGNAIAHEFGHLLLGPNAHSSDGIMRAHWSREFLQLANHGCLHFTTEQAQLMRAHRSEALQVPMMAALQERRHVANENH